MTIYVAVAFWWVAFPVAAVTAGWLLVEGYRKVARWWTLRRLWNDRRPGYLPLNQARRSDDDWAA